MLGTHYGILIADVPDRSGAAALSIAVTSTGAFRNVQTHELLTSSRSARRCSWPRVRQVYRPAGQQGERAPWPRPQAAGWLGFTVAHAVVTGRSLCPGPPGRLRVFSMPARPGPGLGSQDQIIPGTVSGRNCAGRGAARLAGGRVPLRGVTAMIPAAAAEQAGGSRPGPAVACRCAGRCWWRWRGGLARPPPSRRGAPGRWLSPGGGVALWRRSRRFGAAFFVCYFLACQCRLVRLGGPRGRRDGGFRRAHRGPAPAAAAVGGRAVAGWWVAAEAVRDRWSHVSVEAMSQAGVRRRARWAAVGGAPLLTFLLALACACLAWLRPAQRAERLASRGQQRRGRPRRRAPARAGLRRRCRAGAGRAVLPVDQGIPGGPTATVAAIQGDVPHARNLPDRGAAAVTQYQTEATQDLAAQVRGGLPARA